MTPMELTLHNLKTKMQQAHTRNNSDVRDEATLIKTGKIHRGRGDIKLNEDGEVESVSLRYARKGPSEEDLEEQAKMNMSKEDKERLKQVKMMQNTIQECEEWREKKEKKKFKDNGGDGSLPYRGFTKRLETEMLPTKDTTPANSAVIPDVKPTPAQLQALKDDIADQKERRDPLKRRDAYYEGKDIDYINENNKKFNEKLSRDYDKYLGDIKANVERGSAL